MLSILILTYNSADTIETTLKSLRWCEKIVVVDSGSQDNTRDICRKFTSTIYEHPYSNYGDQLNWALDKIETEWVLVVDSDEELSSPLQEEIQELFRQGGPLLHRGYYLPRKSKFLGRWIEHSGWYPDYVLRLFKKEGVHYKKRKLGSSPLVDGVKGYLKGDLLHYPYRGLDDYLKKFQKYTQASAEEMYAQGRNATYFDLSLRPLLRFWKSYCWKRGFLDGFPGLILAVLSSYYVFMKYAKLWEMRKRRCRNS